MLVCSVNKRKWELHSYNVHVISYSSKVNYSDFSEVKQWRALKDWRVGILDTDTMVDKKVPIPFAFSM